jgi:ferredoxin-NADP reductase
MAIQKFDVVFESQRQISPNVLHLVFTRQDGGPFDFVPGQFLTFLLPHPECVKRRSYSLATMPGESGKIEVSMSYVEGGYASEIFFSLKAGDTFHVMGPAGKLVMADDSATRYVLVGTGTGIAPYRTMLPGLASRMKANPTFDRARNIGTTSFTVKIFWQRQHPRHI